MSAPGIVLELVEGNTLADVIARGPIAVSDALPIALQIADALEAAHEKGVIHRDLKPANVKLRSDGTVKVWLGEGARSRVDERRHVAIADSYESRGDDADGRHSRHGGVYEPGTGQGTSGREAE